MLNKQQFTVVAGQRGADLNNFFTCHSFQVNVPLSNEMK